MIKTVVITGASSGIGSACAKIFDQHSFHLILCGRNEERLLKLQKELKNTSEIKIFDVSNKKEVYKALENIESVDLLINNAGNAHGLSSFDEMPLEDMEAMIFGNVMGVIYVTKALMPAILKAKNANIVNLSSIAGKEVYPNGAVYCASKAAVESLSKGIRMDLVNKGIRVINIAPGLVETDFSLVRFKGDKEKAEKVYQNYKALEAKDVAKTIFYAFHAEPHIQLADITLTPTAQASSTLIYKKS